MTARGIGYAQSSSQEINLGDDADDTALASRCNETGELARRPTSESNQVKVIGCLSVCLLSFDFRFSIPIHNVERNRIAIGFCARQASPTETDSLTDWLAS